MSRHAGAVPTTVPGLLDAWAEAMADVRQVVDDLGLDGWQHPSVLPGWTVADVVAHLSWIEATMLGHVDPLHDPDWSRLPHATTPLSRITETAVDLRRGWSRAEVLAELDAAVARRRAAVAAGPQDPATPTRDPFGRPSTLAGVLRMRTFDTWVHSQDIRLAVGRPGGTLTAAAAVAADQIAGALGYVWAKQVAAPAGATLTVRVTPPGLSLVRSVVRAEDGRGRQVADPAQPTATLTLSFDDFVQLGCGREVPGSSTDDARLRVAITGDPDLGQAALEHLNIAP